MVFIHPEYIKGVHWSYFCNHNLEHFLIKTQRFRIRMPKRPSRTISTEVTQSASHWHTINELTDHIHDGGVVVVPRSAVAKGVHADKVCSNKTDGMARCTS